MTNTRPGLTVIDGRLVQLGFTTPNGAEVPLVHLQGSDGLTRCGGVFRAKGVASTDVTTDATCPECHAATATKTS